MSVSGISGCERLFHTKCLLCWYSDEVYFLIWVRAIRKCFCERINFVACKDILKFSHYVEFCILYFSCVGKYHRMIEERLML